MDVQYIYLKNNQKRDNVTDIVIVRPQRLHSTKVLLMWDAAIIPL